MCPLLELSTPIAAPEAVFWLQSGRALPRLPEGGQIEQTHLV